MKANSLSKPSAACALPRMPSSLGLPSAGGKQRLKIIRFLPSLGVTVGSATERQFNSPITNLPRQGLWGIQMRILACLLIAIAPGISLCADTLDKSNYALSDLLGQVNAWRLIPSALLARCSKELPKGASERQETFQAWNKANEKLISSIERVVEMTAARFSSSIGLSSNEAKDQINTGTATLIEENYFQTPSISVAQVCADYSKIIENLSNPGKVAMIRGQVYAVEGLLAARQSSAGRVNQINLHAQPNTPSDLAH